MKISDSNRKSSERKDFNNYNHINNNHVSQFSVNSSYDNVRDKRIGKKSNRETNPSSSKFIINFK
jgi:hypothetical protein